MFNNKNCIPCQGGIPPLSGTDILKYQKLISKEWSIFDDKKLVREFEFKSFNDSVTFVNLVADLAEKQGHHPYIHINFKIVVVNLFTHKIDGLHENDFLMTKKIDDLY